MRTVDLNADIGEGCGSDDDLIRLVSSASIACGAHAGDERTTRAAIEAALRHGVSVGAHPGYADRASFGRAETGESASRIRDLVLAQLEAFATACADLGAALSHVKPHGALYNRAQRDAAAASAIVEAVARASPGAIVFGMPDSELLAAASRAGLSTAREGFLDRAYDATGGLLPRDRDGAVISSPADAAARAESIVLAQSVETADGTVLGLTAETLCVHGDNPHAAALLRAARERLEERGVAIHPVTRSR